MNFLESKVLKLKRRSEDAVGVFKKTVSDLATINAQIQDEQDIKMQKIVDLQLEHSELDNQRKQNINFIDKMNKFLTI